jgi:hypothetical protein
MSFTVVVYLLMAADRLLSGVIFVGSRTKIIDLFEALGELHDKSDLPQVIVGLAWGDHIADPDGPIPVYGIGALGAGGVSAGTGRLDFPR